MELTIIFLLIAGLLIGWFFLMRVEILIFLQRVFGASADNSRASVQPQAHPAVRVVSVRHAAPPPSDLEEQVQMERKSPQSEGGIPKWSIGE